MATIALSQTIPSHRSGTVLDGSITPPLSLEAIRSSPSAQTPTSNIKCHITIPNKHLPFCPSGTGASDQLDTPPESPKSASGCQPSILSPPDAFTRKESGSMSLYKLTAADVVQALDFASRQQLPDPSTVFPWFHGLHPQNHLQQNFFNGRRRRHRKAPSCFRAITVVKADGHLDVSRLKGAVSPTELIRRGPRVEFLEADPQDGFSVRNFHIQHIKMALMSDIIVYGDDAENVETVAWDFSAAQQRWRQKNKDSDHQPYNTFMCTSPFEEFENNHPHIVSVDSKGILTGNVLDLAWQERLEMWKMTEASEISHNVFVGPTPEQGTPEEGAFDILVECSDDGRLNPEALQLIAEMPSGMDLVTQRFHNFPSSGSIPPPTWTQTEADGILETCKWLYHLANGTRPAECPSIEVEGDTFISNSDDSMADATKQRKILIHCSDGYTESTMLAIAYFSYSTGLPIPEAWLNLHTTKHRDFFAYPSDVALLTTIAPRLLHESPVCAHKSLADITNLVKEEPSWLPGLDGSLPSRILDYMYLGSLSHANNPDLLRELGIGQLLSVGETAIWRDGDMEAWGEDNVCHIEGVQDNGIDPLTDQFARCLEFIERGRQKGTATLVHCRVGVSRSATIVIAEVMRALNLSLPRAYCFVRARRLNVVIQPHLRFTYELLRWEETLRGDGGGREMEWAEIAREIALMNRPFTGY